ncbi:hypothetical protein JCM6882_005168 [Rhodosporidiobolus microsporus]
MATVQLKLTHGTTLRKVPYPRALPPAPYASLLSLIKQRFNFANSAQIELLVEDEDGDWVTVVRICSLALPNALEADFCSRPTSLGGHRVAQSSDAELVELFASLKPDEGTIRMQLRTVEASEEDDPLLPFDPVSTTSPAANEDDLAKSAPANATVALRVSALCEDEFPPLSSCSSGARGEDFPDELVGTSAQPTSTSAALSSLSAPLPSLLSDLKASIESLASNASASSHPALARLPSLVSSLSNIIPSSLSAVDLPRVTDAISALSADVAAAVKELAGRAEENAEKAKKGIASFQAVVEKAKERLLLSVGEAALAQAGAASRGATAASSPALVGDVSPDAPIPTATEAAASSIPSSSSDNAPLDVPCPPSSAAPTPEALVSQPALSPEALNSQSASSPEALAANQQQHGEAEAKREAKLAARAAKEERKRAKEQERREKAERREERAGRRMAREERRRRREKKEKEANEREIVVKEKEKGEKEERGGGIEANEVEVNVEVEGEKVEPDDNAPDAAAETDLDRMRFLVDEVDALLHPAPGDDYDSSAQTLLDLVNSETDGSRDDMLYLLAVDLVIKTTATRDEAAPQTAARFARLVMERVSPDIINLNVRTEKGDFLTGPALWRKYLLNRTQTIYEDGGDNPGLLRFMGHLFLQNLLTERILHGVVKKLLTANADKAKEEDIVDLCSFVNIVGLELDSPKGRVHMDVYFSRMRGIAGDSGLSAKCREELTALIARRAAGWPPLPADSTTPKPPSPSKSPSPPSTSSPVAASTFSRTNTVTSHQPPIAAAAAASAD